MKSLRPPIVALALSITWTEGVAFAQVANAAAEALFKEGKALMEKADLAGACAKFAESERLDASSGTMLNLARCYALQGKTASAWAKYLEAGRIAKEQGRAARAAEAKKKAAELEPDLSYLTIVAGQLPADATLELDNVRFESSSFGTKLPIDPGPHFVVVRAASYDEKRLDVTIGSKGDTQTLTIPSLTPSRAPEAAATEPPRQPEPAPVAPPVPPPQPEPAPVSMPAPQPSSAAHHTGATEGPSALPWVIGGVGLASLGVGAAFGFLALSSYKDADAACPTHRACTEDAMSQRDTAQTQGWIANVGVGLGVVGLGVATIMLVTSGSSERPPSQAARHRPGHRHTAVEPLVGPNAIGLSFRGEL
jgi:hypothetical protein